MAPGKNGKIPTGKRPFGRKKKRNLFISVSIGGVILLTIAAAFIVLVVKPQMRGERTGEKPPQAITYEEQELSPTEVVIERGKNTSPDKRAVVPKRHELPTVAIIIDDMGYQLDTGMKLLDLDLELSFAFLPAGPYLERLSKKAARKGREILLHFPMEPASESWKPGPGALLIAMDKKSMRESFEKNIAVLPQAAGINNHMGSRFTQNRDSMKIFLGMVKERNLYFLDSMTSRNSVGQFLAREMGIPTARRHVFLDNEQDTLKVKKQIRHLLAMAEKKGLAIGIGHPYRETWLALKDMRPEIRRRAKLVGASRVVH